MYIWWWKGSKPLHDKRLLDSITVCRLNKFVVSIDSSWCIRKCWIFKTKSLLLKILATSEKSIFLPMSRIINYKIKICSSIRVGAVIFSSNDFQLFWVYELLRCHISHPNKLHKDYARKNGWNNPLYCFCICVNVFLSVCK